MPVIKVDMHCPHCGKDFDIELVENATEDDLIEECPLCGHPLDIRLVLDPQTARVIGAEIHRVDGDTDD